METDEILKNNKLIAEFMGFKPSFVLNSKGKKYDYTLPNGFQLIKEVETTIEGEWCEVLEEQDYCMIEDLKFHSSWDWLMPVVEKIEMTTVYSITTDYDRRDEFKGWSGHLYTLWPKDEIIGYILDKRFETKREATWYAVVEYIKWYNKQIIN